MNSKSVFVWQLSAFNLNQKTIISGVLIEGNERKYRLSKSSWNHLRMISSSYFSKPYSNKKVTLISAEQKIITSTNHDGAFIIETDKFSIPEFSLWVENDEEVLSRDKSAKQFFNVEKSELTIVSDIDDTVLISYTGQGMKSIFTTLFKPYHKRGAVRFTQNLFKSYQDRNPNHFYVSRSEMNLYPLLSNFIKHNDLPRGPLILTPFLSFKELVAKSKDPDFKYRSIEWLINRSPLGQFILVGDDSQHDIEIYSRIARHFNDQISTVYIRQTNSKIKIDDSSRWDELCEVVPNAKYFGKDEIYKLL